jgi:menaquinone-specific isochorismate synthase
MMQIASFLKIELANIHTELKKHFGDESFGGLTKIYPVMDLSELLTQVSCESIFYFKSKERDFTFLGLGISQYIKAENLTAFQNDFPHLFLFTDLSFEGDPKTSRFILPEWIFITRNQRTELHILKNLEYKNFSSPQLFFNALFDLNLYDPFLPPWNSYEEYPEHDQWNTIIESCQKLLTKKILEKIVISRKKIYGFESPIEPLPFFKTLLEKNDASRTYHILHQSRFGSAFLCISPEMFFSLEGNLFESISLAGSAPRGKTPEEDASLERLLNSSEKLIHEQALVTKEITDKLTPLCLELQVLKLETMKLPYIQHRASPIKAILKEKTEVIELIKLLHPTPAVGGLPWNEAKKKISELEPYARGKYAAPIGIIGSDYTELAVGIRSALIENQSLTLFGGAGIVKGSIAEDEWSETGVKMNPFLKVVNHD